MRNNFKTAIWGFAPESKSVLPLPARRKSI